MFYFINSRDPVTKTLTSVILSIIAVTCSTKDRYITELGNSFFVDPFKILFSSREEGGKRNGNVLDKSMIFCR